ncbi:FUSC family protein [Flexivirga caeni]|uniref:FUSC family protein n=1 Tax=Flexivirga caeni TaxID=2294115 RepID=A0A3M9M6E9_9MICO|nr:FUSC family protein [Flexivirga caeni]RNI21154.1 FUSC family protein [Flexivirga caeni]
MRLAAETINRQLLAFAEIKPAPGRWKFALHVLAIVIVAITLVGVLLGPSMALIGIIGAFIGFIAQSRPIRSRIVILAGLDITYIVCVAVGALVGSNPVLLTLVLTLIALATVLGYNSLVGEPPGAMFLIIGPAIASYLPTVGVPAGKVILVGAISSISASATSLLLQAVTQHRHAEQDALDAAETAVRAYLDADRRITPRHQLARLRDQAYGGVFAASMILEDAVGREPRRREWRRMNAELRRMHLALVQQVVTVHLPGREVVVSGVDQRRYLGRPDASYLLRWGLSRSSLPWLAARRMAAAVLLACVVSYGLHVGHPYWATMTTALVMSVTADRLALTHRALHRVVGTIVGIGLFFAIHATHPTGLVVLLIALVLIFFIQLLSVRNYALSVLFVTPMALLISTAGSPYRPVGTIAGERLLETVIGAACSVLVIWLAGRRAPIALVRRQFRRSLRCLERLLLLIADGQQGTEQGYAARRDLAFEQLQCSRILQLAQTDLPKDLADWDLLETSLNEASYVVLAACWTADPPHAIDAEQMAGILARMIAALPPVGTQAVDARLIAGGLQRMLAAGKNLNSS